MSFFISDAVAQTAASAAPQSSLISFLPLILIFGAMYFLMIRPQQKKMKDHQAMVQALGKGDEITTNGGILGKIVSLEDSFVTVEIAPNVTIKLQRVAVAAIMPKGTIKAIK